MPLVGVDCDLRWHFFGGPSAPVALTLLRPVLRGQLNGNHKAAKQHPNGNRNGNQMAAKGAYSVVEEGVGKREVESGEGVRRAVMTGKCRSSVIFVVYASSVTSSGDVDRKRWRAWGGGGA